ncbi:metallophosphoesterase [Cochleicola gelatinilyticus]|uniref:Phosphoesterase n=1 Tax=Cochleicola gelatinilyticus TaxID=1763537 RepID=A0A167G9A9_9FLAO|nr:metallophosphoesterase [Cochleicola gelatinilyticus]OAB77353.1 hypothetical protein ULVI_12685 [Cochleicola gelatinilyticus]
MNYPKLILFSIVLTVLTSCATSGISIDEDHKTGSFSEEEKRSERFYIIGNASNSQGDKVPILETLQKEIKKDTLPAHVVFIGDNVEGKAKNEATIKKQLDQQLEVVKSTGATPYFIPGNYDWNFNKTKGLETIEDYLEDRMNAEDILTPNNGCPLESIEISKDVQLVIVDSQWYIEYWYLHPQMNDKCEIKTREKLLAEIEGEFKKNANKTIIFAIHHPVFTNGFHGGRFSFRDHIFPLQGNIPVPFLGSLIAQIRAQGGISIQDRFNKKYNELMSKLLPMLDTDKQRIIVVSGHEQNLQYIEQGAIKQVISGAGGESKPVTLSDNGVFSYGKNGFASLEVFKNGRVAAHFFGRNTDNTPALLYSTKVFGPTKLPDTDDLATTFPETFTASVYDLSKVEKSDFFKSFWGAHYREAYGAKVTAKTAFLDTLYGGLEVVRPGGGHQTESLRLVTKDGKEYNMRALKKSAVQFLETTTFKGINGDAYFSNTLPEELILDFFTAAHPYGAFAIPTLAKAAGVYYTTPELFYVPKQKALEKYNEEYGDQLYMIVERPAEEYKTRKSFGYPDDIESTDDLLKKLREDEAYVLDEQAYIRARIFDMLIGDWDRHSDQWRWAEFEGANDSKTFVPIPRDRDQVFANFDGSFLNTMRSLIGAVNQFGVYGNDIVDVKWFNEAGAKLDRALVKRSAKQEWIAQAQAIQESIDESILEEAFSALPNAVQDETISEIKKHFLGRKKNLVEIVERYYEEFIKFQMLTGTDKDDLFEIERLPKGETRIRAFRIKDGEKGDELFDRTFRSNETEEIWLYGLDDDDKFVVSGTPEDPMLIRIIGGQDEDSFSVANGKKIEIYDNRTEQNTVKEQGGAKVRFTKFYTPNLYDYTRKKTTSGKIGLGVNYNPDTGASIHAKYLKNKNEFLLNPYSKRTEITIDYQFLTQGLDIHFNKGFASIFSDFNFITTTRFTSKNYTENFFGFGNNSKNLDEVFSFDYNRVNMSVYHGGIGVERASQYGSFFQVKLDVDAVELVRNGANFIAENRSSELEDRSYFFIPNTTYQYKNYDAEAFPTKGMLFKIKGGYIDDLGGTIGTGFAEADLVFYNALSNNRNFVLKTGVSTYLTVGDAPRFYQQARIGANNGLRGFRNDRFTGDHSLTGTAELSYSFEPIKTFFFPLNFSVYTGFDTGRVWVANNTSNRWHHSLGGGFMVQWTEALHFDLSVFNSDEGSRFGVGFQFSY